MGIQAEKLDAMPVVRFRALPAPHHDANHRTKAAVDKILRNKRERLASLIAGRTLDTCARPTDIYNQAVLQIDWRDILIKIAYPRMFIYSSPAKPPALSHRSCISPLV